MACSYCYHHDPKSLPFRRGFMKKETAFKILTQAAECGVHSVKFNWKGEATLNPYYKEIVSYAKSLAKGSTFIDRLTNSNFKIHPQKREEVFEGFACLTKVKVSYDSFRKDVFEKQRFKGNHDLTTENIDLFYNHPLRAKSGTRLVIQAVRTKLNADEDLAYEFKKRWPDAEISIRDMVAGRIDRDLSEFESKTRDSSKRQSCLQAHVRLIFSHEGHAYPCCPDIKQHLFLGDINKSSLFEIFNSAFAKKLRSDLKSGRAFELDPCKTCSSFESFKGFKPAWNS